MSWIDTHCHLDAGEFDSERGAVVARARMAGVARLVIPAVEAARFVGVAALAHATPGAAYALGIHPMYTPNAAKDDIGLLDAAIGNALADARFVAVGEIGLDF